MSVGHRRILTYGLGEELGRDRLGRIYRAWDIRNNRPVILRLLRVAELAPAGHEEEARVEIRRRIRAAAAVGHPNFPAILEIVPHRDLDLVAYEDVFGEPLSSRIARGAPPVEALRFAIEVAAAIARAHLRGVAHGRITMANLVVGRDDSVRVLDLGIPLAREVPFLVDDIDEPVQAPRDRALELEHAKRLDVTALVRVVGLIMARGAEEPDATGLAGEIVRTVERIERSPRATAAAIHQALVEIARRTPVGRDTSAREPAPPAHVEALLLDRRRALEEPAPFEIDAYADRMGSDAAPPVLSAFEPGPSPPEPPPELPPDEIEGEEEDDDAYLLPEPPRMTALFLPPPEGSEARPAAPEDNAGEAESAKPPRLTPRVAAAVLAGLFTIVAVLSLRSALRPEGGTGAAAPVAADAARVEPAIIANDRPPRPIARAGQPAGTLVVTSAQPDVTVRINDGPPVPLPVTWDDVPARRHVLLVERPGYVSRSDTVNVRANLTTTRFYVLAPESGNR